MTPETAAPQDEAQRKLERKALRNVRGLVDKLEADDVRQRRTTRRIVVVSVLVALVVAGSLYYGMAATKRVPVLVIPPKPAPNSAR